MDTQITVQPQQAGALGLIREAMDRNLSPEHMREFLAVKKDWEADEARKRFSSGVAEFQRRCPIIEKEDLAHDKKYARIDRIWLTIRPLLGELGLSVTWQICEMKDQLCHVEGTLGHKDGHNIRLVRDVPLPEIIRGQNKAQQAGSASSYAQRYALCGALGIVTGDDDDGHGAGVVLVTLEQAEELGDLVDVCRGINGFNEKAFWGYVGAMSTSEIKADRYADAKAQLQKKIKGPSA